MNAFQWNAVDGVFMHCYRTGFAMRCLFCGLSFVHMTHCRSGKRKRVTAVSMMHVADSPAIMMNPGDLILLKDRILHGH